MRKLQACLVVFLLSWAPCVQAAPTIDDAKNLVLKAAEELSKVGLAKACAEFQAKPGPYWNGELYVFVINLDGVWECYPPKPDAVGTGLLSLRDVDGKEFIREMIDLAKTNGDGTIDYKWKNPENGLIQEKSSFVKRVGGLVVAAGVFH